MNILFITAPDPPNQFHRIRAHNFIKYLSREHSIYLVSLTRQKNGDHTELLRWCREVHLVHQPLTRAAFNCIRSLPAGLPLEVAYCQNPAMCETVATVLARKPIDLIYVKRLRGAQFVPPDTMIPCILDTTDAMSWYYDQAKTAVPWYRKPLFYEEAVKYHWYERKMLRRFHHWVVCSHLDATALRKIAPPATRLTVVPNGVDIEYFQPTAERPEPSTVLFSGLMDKFVNTQAAVWFAREIFPRIRPEIPEAKAYVVGPKPTAAVRQLAGFGITVTGVVPDIREYIRRSAVVVCPVRTGVGTRNKILQAWAVGRPVVSTTKGVEGLAAADGKHILIADDAGTFARQTILLLRDDNQRQRLVDQGRTLVTTTYAMEVVAKTLEELLTAVRTEATVAEPNR